MLKAPRPLPRRRPRVGWAHLCAVLAALLLLLSVSVLYSRLGFLSVHSPPSSHRPPFPDLLLADESDAGRNPSEDLIDESDIFEVEEDEEDKAGDKADGGAKNESSELYWDHVAGVSRRAFDKPVTSAYEKLGSDAGSNLEQQSKTVFTSDDLPLDESVRAKLGEIKGVEDALLLKSGMSQLRDGWAPWFEQKGVFLRRDRMFRSNLESLNPLNHPLLQDPDMPGITSLTRGDKIVQKAMWKDIAKLPFGSSRQSGRETLRKLNSQAITEPSLQKTMPLNFQVYSGRKIREPIYADGRRWGYYPGLNLELSFSEFMRQFFRRGNCSMRIFMVWNSPDWMYGVRHQRGLESVLRVHPDACVVVFSETIELNFFSDFVDDGYKVAVIMPNLDELLKGTPVLRFASVWHKWRKIPLYPIHYSELVSLAALYKYGGVYLDTDVIVLKPLYSLRNSIAKEDELTKGVTLNGAVMAFKKRSPFIMECMREFYSTYDDTLVRWNGADLLSRVSNRLRGDASSPMLLKLKIEPASEFFPISSENIARYFTSPIDEADAAQQDALFQKILDESVTFHFWNSLTFSLVPESNSLVERLLNHHCLHCMDVL